MPRGQRRPKDQKLIDEITKIDESLAQIEEKKKNAVANLVAKEKELKEKKKELENELESMKKDAVANLIANSGMSLSDIEKLLSKAATEEKAAAEAEVAATKEE